MRLKLIRSDGFQARSVRLHDLVAACAQVNFLLAQQGTGTADAAVSAAAPFCISVGKGGEEDKTFITNNYFVVSLHRPVWVETLLSVCIRKAATGWLNGKCGEGGWVEGRELEKENCRFVLRVCSC